MSVESTIVKGILELTPSTSMVHCNVLRKPRIKLGISPLNCRVQRRFLHILSITAAKLHGHNLQSKITATAVRVSADQTLDCQDSGSGRVSN